ncbi:EndoU domain-containing protein [Psychrobacillus sp. FSL K6-4046]|uniref:EndoU domain-containing protein n=1 Tax=Psychrobacillus sp. FSL K6-4046 TaxID=2921550 RepID=UPI003159D94B
MKVLDVDLFQEGPAKKSGNATVEGKAIDEVKGVTESTSNTVEGIHKGTDEFSYRTSQANNVNISESSIKHSNIGDFTTVPKTGDISKMKGGGHGQSNIEFLEINNLDYNITKVYENGVRVGNVPGHKVKAKRTGSNQSWFPENWTESDIKAAGAKSA